MIMTQGVIAAAQRAQTWRRNFPYMTWPGSFSEKLVDFAGKRSGQKGKVVKTLQTAEGRATGNEDRKIREEKKDE